MKNLGGRAASLALVALCLSLGCGGATKTTAGAESAVVAPPASALESSGIAAILPRNTALVMAVANPAAMVEDVGMLRLLDVIEELREAREELRKEIGLDLFSPEGWAEVGIDAAAPAGFALVDVKRELGVLAVSLRDGGGDVFAAKVKEIAAKEGAAIEDTVVGGARVIDADEVMFVMRDRWLLTAVGSNKDGVRDLATTLASSAPDTSLATLPAYKTAVETLSFGASMAAWFDFASVARQTGEEEIAKEFDAAVMGLEVSGTAVETQMILGLASTGKVRQVFGAHTGAPAIVRTAARAPLFLTSLAINIPGVLELAAQEGDDLDDARASVRQALGMDLDKDILPLATGEVGLRVNVDQDQLNQGNPTKAFGGAIALGLRDVATARPRVEEILAKPMFGLTKSPDGDYFRAPPTPWVQVYIGVAGDALVATTDPKTFEFVANGGASFADTVNNAGLSRVLTTEGATLLSTVDLGQAIAAASSLLPGQDDEIEAPNDLPDVGPQEYTKLIEEAAALRETMKKQRAELADLRARVRDLGGRWGSVASTGRVNDTGMRFDGGVYLAANETLAVVVSDTVRWMVRLDELDGEYKRSKWRHRDLVREARELLGRPDSDGEGATEMAK